MLNAGEFIADLVKTSNSPRGENLPVNEGQIRPLLTSVAKEHRLECWAEIVKHKVPSELTGTAVGAGVRKFLQAKGFVTRPQQRVKANEQDMLIAEVGKLCSRLAKLPNPETLHSVHYEITLKIDRRVIGDGQCLLVIDSTIAMPETKAA